MKKLAFISLIVLAMFTSCHNQDWEFPDYKYTTVYFPYQSPVRTLVLGKDIYDNTLDNAHKCNIMATMGGVYKNEKDRILDVVVDNSLCDNLIFEGDSNSIIPMPASYYSLATDMKIVIPSGSLSGGIEVKLTDNFFADPLAIGKNYVIPLRITSVTNADSVLSGKGAIENPNRLIADDWAIAPKDYILYCVKYINPWHGAYLRRGVNVSVGNNGNTSLDTTIVYRNKYVERDQVVKMYTVSMDEVSLVLKTREKGNSTDMPFELRIKVDNAGKCTVLKPDSATTYTVAGTGEFVNDGDYWGEANRDVMRLKYSVDFGTSTHTFTDTIVMRDRQVTFETFNHLVVK